MDMYRDIILDHYKHPRNFGTLSSADAKASEYNATCGDRISIEIQCQMINAKCQIKDIRFSGEGCAISVASASMLTEKVKGMKVENVLKLATEDILVMLGTELTPSRTKCAVLPLEVLQKAVVCLGL
ncbi:SUF system NifU family Fe-S cluster assembly protein [Candidatus Gottesmanbacteria bacterium RIFCSPLOWO2_01_FULL_48_11]|nr:MAG: SUF system NifU family Fe-S cluster assembly protein [Candidatus Gottesmanbacteria bacterium RIFCSPLOWO2_01_FULL_48_11]